MTATEIKSMICDVLGGIAPEADFSAVGGNEDLREALSRFNGFPELCRGAA